LSNFTDIEVVVKADRSLASGAESKFFIASTFSQRELKELMGFSYTHNIMYG